MKQISRISLLLFIFILLFAQASPASAHPADLYAQAIHLKFTKDGLSVQWEIMPGPLLISFVWFNADENSDDKVSPEEAEKWITAHASLFTATLEHARLPLHVDSFQFPSNLNSFQSGAETIKIQLSAAWPENLGDSYELAFYNGAEENNSINWYFVAVQDGLKFQTPQQDRNLIKLKLFEPSAQGNAGADLLTEWDSTVPLIARTPTSRGTETAQQGSPGLPIIIPNEQRTSQQILLDLVRQKDLSVPFYLFALGISLVLGAFHALTPGHGKTVVAAYLVGSRGTTRHAVALGTVVTLTHTGSVFLLGIVTLVASRYILPTSIIPVLEVLSGLLIVGLGLYLLWQRYQQWRKAGPYQPTRRKQSRKVSLQPRSSTAKALPKGYKIQNAHSDHDHFHEHSHTHTHDHGDGHVHSHDVPEEITWRSLIALGVSGGLVPCPDAIAILLVAIAINRILLGLTLIVSFSLGLAVVLIVIGLLMVNSRRLFDRMTLFDRFAPILPMASALVVLALGIVLTVGAFAQAKNGIVFTGAGAGSLNEAKVLYLSGGQDSVKSLFVAEANGRNPIRLSNGSDNVLEYALSPDQSRVVYIVQTEDLKNSIWMVDVAGGDSKKILACEGALCSRPAWSPDGARVVFEYTRLSGEGATGLASLWWLDIKSGEARSVFQEGQLPGSNPRWSPDGQWLSYAMTQEIRLYNINTGESHAIKNSLSALADWSPDSTKILYRDVVLQQDRQFVTQIYTYDLSTRQTTKLDLEPGYENLFATWSPDGAWIAMTRRDLSVSRGDQVWVARADGSEVRILDNKPGELHGNLNWSPDGRYLLYDLSLLNSSSLDSNLQIMDVQTGKFTDPGIFGYNPSWLWVK